MVRGRVIVSLSDPSIPVDMRQEGGKVLVDFYRTQLPAELERRLDVLDFATPVKTIDTHTKGDSVHMVITPMGEYEYIAYQTDNQFTIEVRALTKEEVQEAKKDEFGYSGVLDADSGRPLDAGEHRACARRAIRTGSRR